MFTTHQKAIGRWGRKSPDNTSWIIAMVLLSIQQQWDQIGNQLIDLKENGLDCKYLFGSKRSGWDYVLAHKKEIHEAIYSRKLPMAEKLLAVASIPNIGLVKAGFVLQLCIGKVGCLDVHNLRRFGLSPSAFKMGKVKYDTALGKAKLYIKVCEDLGGCEYLWNSWCDLLAEKYPNKYKNGQQVSRLHQDYVMLY
tara:strand:+ start:5923 stop:6507 length:585 start_codon:yes stop_codon:yes gene_type:complete